MVESIVGVFEEINSYIMWMISMLYESQFIPLLNYLYTCIPLYIRMVFVAFLLFILIKKVPSLFNK